MPRPMLAAFLATAVLFGTLPLLSLLWTTGGPSNDGGDNVTTLISEPADLNPSLADEPAAPVAYGFADDGGCDPGRGEPASGLG